MADRADARDADALFSAEAAAIRNGRIVAVGMRITARLPAAGLR